MTTAQVTQEMSRLLNWQWFWEGQVGTKPYVAGRIVDVAVVESSNEVVAFISEIGVAAYFHFDNGKVIRKTVQSIGDQSNVSAVNRYIANYGVTPGFAFKQGKGPTSPDVAVRRENLVQEQKRQILRQRSMSFTLPNLYPPDHIVSRRSPPDLAHLESVVRSRLEEFYSANCGPGEIRIPYFALEDPAVYVYADLGSCDKGIIAFVRNTTGQWTSGQFSPSRPPHQWSTTIQRIRENTVVAIPLPERPK